jgi:hypothetical protein
MTIIVSLKIDDDVVMAADRAGSMVSGQIYAHANKIINICEGLPVGAMSTGSGGIGNQSIEALLKDLRQSRGSGSSSGHAPGQRLERRKLGAWCLAGERGVSACLPTQCGRRNLSAAGGRAPCGAPVDGGDGGARSGGKHVARRSRWGA